jgi:hypothetical protein
MGTLTKKDKERGEKGGRGEGGEKKKKGRERGEKGGGRGENIYQNNMLL